MSRRWSGRTRAASARTSRGCFRSSSAWRRSGSAGRAGGPAPPGGSGSGAPARASRAAVANGLGTVIEIDEVLGNEVGVVYHVDSRGRAVLDGVRVGPQATIGVIRAHEVVVTLLRRYEGVLGKLREVTDRLLSLAGFPPAGVNPFPPGTQAFESFLELKKLPEVIESRRAALGLSLGTDSE